MSYARFGPDSDVYVFGTATGYECCRCAFQPPSSHEVATAAEMIAHLREHRAAGHRVPEDAFEDLALEA